MSRYSAAIWDDDGNLVEHRILYWRQFPDGRGYRDYGWWRFYWGDKELAWIVPHPGRGKSWDVIIQAGRDNEESNALMSDYSGMGQGFATRWHASEYVLKCLGIQPKRG